jgi:hypothetical protein
VKTRGVFTERTAGEVFLRDVLLPLVCPPTSRIYPCVICRRGLKLYYRRVGVPEPGSFSVFL